MKKNQDIIKLMSLKNVENQEKQETMEHAYAVGANIAMHFMLNSYRFSGTKFNYKTNKEALMQVF